MTGSTGTTVQLKEARWVDAPLGDVFEFTADFSNAQMWDPGVAGAARADNEPLGVGTRFNLEVVFGTSTIPMTYEITDFKPDELVVLEGRGEHIHALDTIRFARQDNLTLIDYTADLTFTGPTRFAIPLMKPLLRRVGRRALDGLAAAFAA